MYRNIFSALILIGALFILPTLLMSADKPGSSADGEENSDKEMFIENLVFDPSTQSPVVLLADKDKSIVVPIWIGLCEARSIEIGVSDMLTPRPMTYDFIAAVIRSIGAKVERIVVVDIRDQIYYAQVELSVDGKLSKIDARPSDAIALAKRMGAPIYIENSVLDKAALPDPSIEERGL